MTRVCHTGCWDYLPIFGGEHPASEPETQAVMQFVLAHHLTALISYHSAALGIFPGGDPADPASQRLAEEIAAVTDYPFPGLNSGCFYSGTFTDWAASNGVAAVDVELHNHYETDYQMNVRVLLAFLSWQRNEEGIPPLGQR